MTKRESSSKPDFRSSLIDTDPDIHAPAYNDNTILAG